MEGSTALLDRLKARTAPAKQAKRGKAYNYPPKWYAKPGTPDNPEGDVVLLPGDPNSRAYYEDKGFAMLREDEQREWEQEVRPKVIARQRHRAGVIGAIRRVAAKHPTVQIVADFEILTDEELDDILKQMGEATGTPVKIIQSRIRSEPEEDLTAGTTIGAGDELEAKLKRAATQRRGPQ